MGSQGTEAELDVGEERQGGKAWGGGVWWRGRREQAGGRRAPTRGGAPGVLRGGHHLLVGDPAQVGQGMGREVSVPVVVVSWKVTALSGMPHTFRTDTWQV